VAERGRRGPLLPRPPDRLQAPQGHRIPRRTAQDQRRQDPAPRAAARRMSDSTPSVRATLDALGLTLLERGWLSANNCVITGNGPAAVVDTGYGSHAPQTLGLVRRALHGRTLDLIVNTHLHSDHCGGNAVLQAHFPGCRTAIPPGQWEAVREWDPVALTYTPTGQECPRFRAERRLLPGTELQLGDWHWQIHAAPGHDPHSIILFQPDHRVLISADALWQNGFGVVFPELEGTDAFDDVGRTIDIIESLRPAMVIPGHGSVFTEIGRAPCRERAWGWGRGSWPG